MIEQAFHVVSEFKFEIGSALLGAKTLQNAVGELSNAADDTLLSFQKMGVGFAAQMGLGTGGILGILYEAIQASEKFGASQRKMANIFLSNGDKIAGGPVTFQKAMEVSSEIMDDIAGKARKWGLPGGPFAQMSTNIGAALFSAGAAGNNLEPAMDMARGMLKTAPVLGIDPNQAQGELLDLVNGRGHMQGQFIQRLVADTDVFKALMPGGANARGSGGSGGSSSPLSAFNALNVNERVKTINAALLQFASNTNIVKANAASLTQQIQVLKDTFIGMFSILRPIGEALTGFLAPALIKLNHMLQTNGVKIGQQLGLMLGKVLGDPETLIANLFQLKSLKRDMKSAEHTLGVAGIAGAIGAGLKFFGVTVRLFGVVVTPWLSAIAGGLSVLYDVFMRTPSILPKVLLVGLALAAIGAVITTFPIVAGVLAVSAALTGLFQLFSRAEGIAAIKDAKEMPMILEENLRILNVGGAALGRLTGPFTAVFDALAEAISPIFRVAFWIKALNMVLLGMASTLTLVEGMFSGLLAVIATFMDYITSSKMVTDPAGIFDAMGKSFADEFDRVSMENLASLSDPIKGAVSNRITNIGKVEIRNDFKDQLEPDRIAFTMKEQIMKAAQNPGQGGGRSILGGLASGY